MRATAFNCFVLLPLLLLLSRVGSACKSGGTAATAGRTSTRVNRPSSVQAAAATSAEKVEQLATEDAAVPTAPGTAGQERLTPAKRFYRDEPKPRPQSGSGKQKTEATETV
uniref:Secreted protein n=1 Tax=Macrostomum lignano TaxID=282301 RepID=A0A1I8F997_9PLAT